MKRLLYIVIICVVFVGVFLLLKEWSTSSPQQTQEEQQAPAQQKSPSDEEEDNNSDDVDVSDIIARSKQGEVPGSTIQAGSTKMNAVTNKWGSPEQVSGTPSGKYGSYPDKEVTLGYQDGLIFDVRYAGSPLKNTHLKDIKAEQGEPDHIRYYKDKQHNQIILVYQVTERYQLKWVLPKPSDEVPNPTADHISVWTKVQSDVEKTISTMSLDEKIGQMIIAGFTGTTLTKETKDLIQNKKVGGMIFYTNNLVSPSQTVQLVNNMKAANKGNKSPLFLSVDQEGGRVSRLPANLKGLPTNKKIGNVNNYQFSKAIGKVLGNEVKDFGFNLNYAPVMDVNSNPDNPVIGDRSFSSDPEVVGRLGIQTMKGMRAKGVIPVIKHFPGHGDTSTDSHLQLPRVDKTMEDLQDMELIPFKQAINEGTDVIMIAHILLPQLDAAMPASMSRQIITGLLRKQLGFEGIVITDDMTMNAITNNFGIEQASVDAVKAGSDILLVAHDYNKVTAVINKLKNSVKNGEISEDRINRSVERVLKLKEKYHLNNKKIDQVDVQQLNRSIQEVIGEYLN